MLLVWGSLSRDFSISMIPRLFRASSMSRYHLSHQHEEELDFSSVLPLLFFLGLLVFTLFLLIVQSLFWGYWLVTSGRDR